MTAFKNPEDNCVAKDLMDALTIIHDLDLWDNWVYEYAENPLELIRMVNEDRDALQEAWQEARLAYSIKLISTDRKIPLIKAVRKWTRMGLADAKRIIDHLPIVVPWHYETKELAENSEFMGYIKLHDPDLTYEISGIPNEQVVKYDKGKYYMLEDFGVEGRY